MWTLLLGKSLLNVLDQVLRSFNAHGEPDRRC